METLYDAVNDCYRASIVIKIGDSWHYLKAVLDTGATYTTIAFHALVDDEKDEEGIKRLVKKFDGYAKAKGIVRSAIKGATQDSDANKAYAYAVCFDDAFVGGHLMRKFYTRVMIDGAGDVSVIGNDFLNMCDYQHKAGEHCLVVRNPDEQKYCENFNRKSVLSNGQLNALFSDNDSSTEFI